MLVQIPDELKKLQEPWFLNYDSKLANSIRQGCKLSNFNGRFYKVTTVSGGAGTSRLEPITKEEYNKIELVLQQENLGTKGLADDFCKLKQFLTDVNVNLNADSDDTPSQAFELAHQIYTLLPKHHFGHPDFRELQLGDWGGGAAKYGQYESPKVQLYSCTVTGAKRNFMALLLHETGHSFEEYLKNNQSDICANIKTGFEGLKSAQQTKNTRFAIDFLYGIESRLGYYLSSFSEFNAETYLMYVATGGKFRNFITSLTGQEKEAWSLVYDQFKAAFNGIEYK